MIDPYNVLGLNHDADDEEIRRRYLELVRENPPDRAPQRFTEICAAYESLCDPLTRLDCWLFEEKSSDTLDALMRDVRRKLLSRRIPTDKLLKLAERS